LNLWFRFKLNKFKSLRISDLSGPSSGGISNQQLSKMTGELFITLSTNNSKHEIFWISDIRRFMNCHSRASSWLVYTLSLWSCSFRANTAHTHTHKKLDKKCRVISIWLFMNCLTLAEITHDFSSQVVFCRMVLLSSIIP